MELKGYGPDNQLRGLGWDDEQPTALHTTWQNFVGLLPQISLTSIPRWLDHLSQTFESIEIYTFCDGSSNAYAAAVYIRIQYDEDQIYTHLLASKSKVTPTKPLTIPRVELCGAVLATKLAEWVRRTIRGLSEDTPFYYWTDATIILHWINGDINRWTLYVANRISQILLVSNPIQWRHVSTTENPADCATRGLKPDTLQHFQLWWTDPPQRLFLATGVDYTGAIERKSSKYRGNTMCKGYFTIFICLATKAIHLEAVTGMTTEHFLWALQRFIGRRGMCTNMYSDCGTNFIVAEAVLKINQAKFVEDVKREIVPRLAAQKITWLFNPPHSSNFGGLWKSNVKAIKYHLQRTIGGNRLTFEELSTVLDRIEACLNSRPLCPLTSNPDDLFVLALGHFLIGDALLSLPETAPVNKNLSKQYFELQKMTQNFWSKWSSYWLSHLQSRPKWRNEESNLQLDDIVLVKDDRLPPNQWILGRITELHPGSDQLVRVVTVRTKICHLPISTYPDEKVPTEDN